MLICQNQILLIKNITKKSWSLPGGEVEKGESLYKAIKRELKEELDIKNFTIDYLLGTYRQVTNSRRDSVYVFVAKVERKPLLHLEWEIDEARWFDLAHIPPSTNISVKKRISELLSDKQNICSNW